MRACSGFLVLCLLAGSARGELVITPEIPVAAPRYVLGTFSYVTIGSDGDSFLLVGPSSFGRLVAIRVTATGEVQDPTGLDLGLAPSDYRGLATIAVRWNGAEYLATWSEVTDQTWITYARRLSRTGELSPLETILTIRADRVYGLIAGATRYLQLYEVSHRLYGVLCDSNLHEIRHGFPIPGGTGQGNAAAASDGENFLVAWENFIAPGFEVMATRLNGDGDALSPAGIFLDRVDSLYSPNAAVQWNGASYVVAWNDHGVEARTVDREGVAGSPVRIVDIGEGVTFGIAMSSDGGSRKLIAWIHVIDNPSQCGERRYSLQGAFLESSVAVADRATLDSSSGCDIFPSASAVKIAGSHIAVSWQRRTFLLSGVSSLSTTVSRTIAVSFTATRQYQPAVASNGEIALVAWDEAGSVTYPGTYGVFQGDRIRVARLRDAVALDGEGIVVSPGGADQVDPAVAGSPDVFLVTWSHLIRPNIHQIIAEIHGRRVSREGVVLDAHDLVLSDRPAGQPRVVWNGSRFLVVSVSSTSLSVTEVAPTGEVIRHTDAAANVNIQELSAAASGSDTLVVWSTGRAVGNRDIVAIRLDATGAPLDPALLRFADSVDDEYAPAVAGAENGWFVTWSRISDLRVATVARNGGLTSETAINAPRAVSSVAASSGTILVLYNSGTTSTAASLTLSLEVRGSRDLGSIGDGFNNGPPAVTMRNGNEFLMAYVRPAPEPLYGGVNRVFARSVIDMLRRRAVGR